MISLAASESQDIPRHPRRIFQGFPQKAQRKNRCKTDPWTLRGIQNRVEIDSRTLLGRPVVAESVPGATRGRLGSDTGGPGSARRVPKNVLLKKEDAFGVPRGVRECTEAIKIDIDPPPGAKKLMFFRTAGPCRPVWSDFSLFSSIFGFFSKCEISVSYHACQ